MPFPTRRVLLGALLGIGVLVVFAVGYIGMQWHQALADVDAMIVTPVALPTATVAPTAPNTSPNLVQPTDEPAPTPESPLPNSPLNILLLGTDARPQDVEPPRTDAMVLVHLDRKEGTVSMLSFPRDLWVTYPGGYGAGRINGAYAIGEKQIGSGGGAALAKATVTKLTGLPIDNYVLLNFAGFKKLIDELGGVTIDVPKTIDDPAYPTEDYKTIKLHFDPGVQEMDSTRALMYARTRHQDSDFGRNERQQQVLMAIFDRVRELGLLQQLTSVENYTGAMRDYVRTDMPKNTMFDIARWGRAITPDDIRRYAVDSKHIVMLNPPATFAADPKALRRLVGQVTGDAVSSAGGTEPQQLAPTR